MSCMWETPLLKVKISPWTVAVVGAFGLGVDEEKVFRIYLGLRTLELRITPF